MRDAMTRPVAQLYHAHQAAAPDAIVETLSVAVESIGGRDVVLFLIDYGQVVLTPHPDVLGHGEDPQVVSLDGSMAGRAYTSCSPLAVERENGWHVWVPVTEQANRLGVLALTLSEWNQDVERSCVDLGLAAAVLVVSSGQYTDLPHLLRRRQNMDLAAEMQWSLLPPLAFAAGGITVAGALEPAYEVGGDCFDYAFNAGQLDFAIIDTVGHGLSSAVLASLLVGAYRHARRAGADLAQMAASIDAAARTHPGSPAFATAILGRLDAASGCLRWVSSGHPQPLIARGGRTLPELDITPGVPLGLGALGPVTGEVVQVFLEPGDGVLMYTDGVVDARTPDDDYFGEDRLRDLLAREHGANDSAREVIRRLVRTALEHSDDLRDDASMLYLCWDGSGDR